MLGYSMTGVVIKILVAPKGGGQVRQCLYPPLAVTFGTARRDVDGLLITSRYKQWR